MRPAWADARLRPSDASDVLSERFDMLPQARGVLAVGRKIDRLLFDFGVLGLQTAELVEQSLMLLFQRFVHATALVYFFSHFSASQAVVSPPVHAR